MSDRIAQTRISIAQPELSGREREFVLDCLDSNWISSSGKYIDAFEKAFAAFCGTRNAVSSNNGTTALHLALMGLGLKPGDEVIVPVVTYIATANAVSYCGARPVFVDVCQETMNIDPAEIEARITKHTKGIIAVHLYGHPADMEAICAIARKHGLWVVEDAAEAHGAEVSGKRVGALGDCATFSFFGNKVITTGEGGMITTDDDELAARMRLYRGQGMDLNRRYWFPVIGYNYRMTNIQAAIGLAQLESIDRFIQKRATIGNWYDAALARLTDKIILPTQADWVKSVVWMYTIFLKPESAGLRDQVIRHLDAKGIETRPVFYPMHKMPPYEQRGKFPVADVWPYRGINLPTHTGLNQQDVERIAEALNDALTQS